MFIVLFIGIIVAVYGGANFYIGYRGLQAFGNNIPHFNKLYWALIFILAVSYLLGRFGSNYLPGIVSDTLSIGGSYWIAAFVYFLMAVVIIDLIRLINKFTGFIPAPVRQNRYTALITGTVVLVSVIVLLIYGALNARAIRTNHYDITLQKQGSQLNQLHIAMVSDLHLGKIVDRAWLEKIIDRINALEPDIVLIPGDIVDDDIGPFDRQGMAELFKSIKVKYGIYASLGNHEFIGGNLDKKIKSFKEAGINILRDAAINVEGSFILVGRDDKSFDRGMTKRKALEDIMTGVDKNLTVIMLDHQPVDLDEAKSAGVDLQLSGHTHGGQLFPFQFITRKIFKKDWGYLDYNGMQMIVSSGAGTWGPPVRIGTNSEVVDIMVSFK